MPPLLWQGMLCSVHARERVVAAHIAGAEQVASVAVERRIGRGITHEGHNRLAG